MNKNLNQHQNNNINKYCKDCLNECKQLAEIEVVYCPIRRKLEKTYEFQFSSN